MTPRGTDPSTFRIMGILNLTPDSFSDGDPHLDAQQAYRRACEMIDDGADIIDIGGESTRPGSTPVTLDVEWARLEPTLKLFREQGLGAELSVDTSKAEIALRAQEFGVTIINNVRGLFEDRVLATLASSGGMSYIAGHCPQEPRVMQRDPLDGGEAIADVERFFERAQTRLVAAGFDSARVWLDPGIGFGKTDRANLQLMAQIPSWSRHYQIAIGVSRKGWIGRLLAIEHATDRDPPTKMIELGLAIAGARLLRTHAVRQLGGLRSLLSNQGLTANAKIQGTAAQ